MTGASAPAAVGGITAPEMFLPTAVVLVVAGGLSALAGAVSAAVASAVGAAVLRRRATAGAIGATAEVAADTTEPPMPGPAATLADFELAAAMVTVGLTAGTSGFDATAAVTAFDVTVRAAGFDAATEPLVAGTVGAATAFGLTADATGAATGVTADVTGAAAEVTADATGAAAEVTADATGAAAEVTADIVEPPVPNPVAGFGLAAEVTGVASLGAAAGVASFEGTDGATGVARLRDGRDARLRT